MPYSDSTQNILHTASSIIKRHFRVLKMVELSRWKFSIRSHAMYIALMAILQLESTRIWCLANKTNPTCLTADCQQLGRTFLKNMDIRIKPCDNFYSYVCNNWGLHNPRPLYESDWNVDQSMENRALERVKKILEDPHPTQNPKFEEARALYKACINLPDMVKSKPPIVKDVMRRAGAWPMFLPVNSTLPSNVKWQDIDDYYTSVSGEPALFDYTILADKLSANVFVIHIRALFSPYGMLKRFIPWTSLQEKMNYVVFLSKVIKSVAPAPIAPYKKQLLQDVMNVVNFRSQLFHIIQRTGQDPKILSLTTKEFQTMYDKEAKGKETAMINWMAKVVAMYKDHKDAYGQFPTRNSMIQVQPNYFNALARLLGNTPQRVLVNHVHLYFAERHLELNDVLQEALDNCYEDSTFPNGLIRYEPGRPERCIINNNLREAFAKMYINVYFPDSVKEDVRRIVEETKRVLKAQILESNWLNDDAKAKALTKVNQLKSQIGYPNWYKTMYANEPHEVNDVDPLKADTFYATATNKLYITAAYLQWPIYETNVPYVIDYGSTVTMFGHEMYHGFDQDGVRHNSNGTKVNWWSPDMYQQYEKQAKCFKDVYAEYRKATFQKLGLQMQPHLSDTTDEDIADAMGLKLAYKGYRQRLDIKMGVCPVLPGFEKFGCEKLFFIAFANSFCEDSTESIRRVALFKDTHSLYEIRVNGAVANMPEFNQAFGCKPKNPPIAKKTCDIWRK